MNNQRTWQNIIYSWLYYFVHVISVLLISFIPISANDVGIKKVIPVAPSNLQVFETSFDYVQLIWNDNSDNEAFFVIERHLEGGSFQPYDTLVANETSYIDYRVEPSTQYFYRLYAYNIEGASGYSNEIETETRSLPHTPPIKPTAVEADFFNGTVVIVNWHDNSDNESEFFLFRTQNPEYFALMDTISADITQFADYEIQANTTYYYYLIASNEFGLSEPSDTAVVNVGDINQIDSTILQISFTSYNRIGLSWNSNSISGFTYSVARIEEDQINVISENLTENHYTDTNLLPNLIYRYQIVINDQHGNQYYSNIAEAKTQPWFIENRASDSLIALYLFADRIANKIPDVSWYESSLDLIFSDTSMLEENNRSSLTFRNGNILTTGIQNASKIVEACRSTNEISIEFWLKSLSNNISGESTIVTFGTTTGSAFSLGIDNINKVTGKATYFSNLTTHTTDNFGNPRFSTEESAEVNTLQHIVFVHKNEGNEYLYLNGNMVAEGFRPSGFDNWAGEYQLILGNNVNNNSPWTGALYLFAIYNKALSFNEINKNYLASPFIESGYILNPDKIEINLWPNPTTAEIIITLQPTDSIYDITENYYLNIVDNDGLIVRSLDISFELGNTIILDLSNLKKGMYTIAIRNKRNLISSKKLLKL